MSADACAAPPKDRAIEGILWLIETGSVGFGGRLPAERDLCTRLGVSRTALRGGIRQLCSQGVLESRHGSGTYVLPKKLTHVFQRSGGFSDLVSRTALRGGIRQLCSQGVLESRHGSGTYVLPKKLTHVFQRSGGFSDLVTRAGRMPYSKLLSAELIEADELVAKKMKVAVGSTVFKLSRVRLADEIPVAIETSFTDYARFPGIDAYDYTDDSLFRVIRDEYGGQAAHGVERLSITRLNEREADLLSAEVGTPAFFEQCFAPRSARRRFSSSVLTRIPKARSSSFRRLGRRVLPRRQPCRSFSICER